MPSGCFLKIGVIGVNFKTADLALREKMARAAEDLMGEKALFFRHPTIVLSTCNRLEVYFSSKDLAEAHNDLLSFFKLRINGSFEQKLYTFFGYDCFSHLCFVASGLDSAILAETEIQRQVKNAYRNAHRVLALPSVLHYVFQKALRVSKQLRSRLVVEQGAPTLFGTLFHLMKGHFQDLSKIQILLVGNSEINRGFASFLERKKVKGYTFCTRAPSKVRGKAVGREELKSWNRYDMISSASYAKEFLIQGGSKREHLIFDLSVPRNVDPNVEKNSLVKLYNIEEIDQMIEQKTVARNVSLKQFEKWVQDYVLKLALAYRKRLLTRDVYALEL